MEVLQAGPAVGRGACPARAEVVAACPRTRRSLFAGERSGMGDAAERHTPGRAGVRIGVNP